MFALCTCSTRKIKSQGNCNYDKNIFQLKCENKFYTHWALNRWCRINKTYQSVWSVSLRHLSASKSQLRLPHRINTAFWSLVRFLHSAVGPLVVVGGNVALVAMSAVVVVVSIWEIVAVVELLTNSDGGKTVSEIRQVPLWPSLNIASWEPISNHIRSDLSLPSSCGSLTRNGAERASISSLFVWEIGQSLVFFGDPTVELGAGCIMLAGVVFCITLLLWVAIVFLCVVIGAPSPDNIRIELVVSGPVGVVLRSGVWFGQITSSFESIAAK